MTTPRTRTLRHGALRFTADESGDQGPVVVCLHGFPDHRRTWRHQLPALGAAGYRAIAPDLRGYEPGSQPADGDYHLTRLAEDLVAWVADLGESRVHLIGHDWGAVIAYTAASMFPERFTSLCTLAVPPAGRLHRDLPLRPRALAKLWYTGLFQIRGLSERLLLARDGELVRLLWRRWSPGWRCPDDELDAVVRVFERPGVATAALSYYRALYDLVTPEGRATWRLFRAPIDVPSLVLYGADDGCLDEQLFRVAPRPGDFPAGVRFEGVAGAGHFFHLERPDHVTRILLDWLETHTDTGAEGAP